jgi:hypothetical protein
MTYSQNAMEVLTMVKASGIEWTPQAQSCEAASLLVVLPEAATSASSIDYSCLGRSLRRSLYPTVPPGEEWGCNVSSCVNW